LGTEGTSAYVSVLMRPQGILHQGAYGGWFALALRGSTDIFVGMNYSQNTYGLEVGFEHAQTTKNAVVGTTAFAVLRIDFTEGVDPVYLYLNPQPGAPEPATPSASLINLNVNFVNTISLTGPGASAFDSLRIGATFSDVAPAVADFDVNQIVNGDDLAIWRTNFGTGTTHGQGDADNDADVDGSDFLILQRQVGFPHAVSLAGFSVPEPSMAWLAGVAICVASLSVFRPSQYCSPRQS